MVVKKQEKPQLHCIKQTSKWIYYADTMFIMLTAFDLYYQDIAPNIKDLGYTHAHALFPAILVILNMVVVIMIWCHFTYPKKTTVLIAISTIMGLLIYRYTVTKFNCLYNIPNMLALTTGTVWILCDQIHHEEEDSLGGRITDSSSPTSSSTPTASLVSAERGTNLSDTLKSVSSSGNTKMATTPN